MRYKLTYIPFIWLTTAILGSMVYYIESYFISRTGAMFSGSVWERVEMFFLCIVLSLVFSIPSVLVFWGVKAILVKSKLGTTTFKTVLATVAVVLIYLTFIYMRATSYALIFTVPCYILPLVGSVYYFRLR